MVATSRPRWSRHGLLLAGSCILGFVACFDSGFVRGLPCESDDGCGSELRCIDGLCGGPGASSVCGNSLIEVDEECDDGNLDDTDSCTRSCSVATCGDGFIQSTEECDDGNDDPTDGCLSNCTIPCSCAEILAAEPESPSGEYELSPYGPLAPSWLLVT